MDSETLTNLFSDRENRAALKAFLLEKLKVSVSPEIDGGVIAEITFDSEYISSSFCPLPDFNGFNIS
jgi:hypothetical protein